jgi:hypothetical protein
MSPYSIQVKYTPKTTGCHVICFHLESGPGPVGPDATYCCVTDTIVAPNQVDIQRTISVDAGTACNGITIVGALGAGTYVYSGYVYPCCDLSEGHDLKFDWPTMPQFIIGL